MTQKTPKLGRGRTRVQSLLAGGLVVLFLALFSSVTQAASTMQSNLVDLIQHANRIVVGTVESTTDGFDKNNVPYTEITLRVSDSIRGEKAETMTFRQFGLLEPREINGRTYLGTSPDGWPKWNERERVMIFLGPPARLTGLQTTIGLQQGKMRMMNGQLSNASRNAGLFDNMAVEARGLSKEQQAMLSTDGVAVDANLFISLVRRAVDEDWVQKGVMHHEN